MIDQGGISTSKLSYFPFIISRDAIFFDALKCLPGLDDVSLLLPDLQDIFNLCGIVDKALMLFVDVDNYAVNMLVHFMQKVIYPNIVVIAITAECDVQKTIGYLRLGMRGVIMKDELSESLVHEIVNAYPSKGFPISNVITQRMIHTLVNNEHQPFDVDLSKREQQILHHLMKGASYKMIAGELGISIETVRHHIKRLYKKLGIKSKGEIIAKMMDTRTYNPFM
ncbi:LuxR C-terminal-related transcriptional regulator [Chitinophaga sp. Cy-1792]|uniref:transcriptional regulator n=1 Tax=Chitinophaga sp. Cy-1792 TaxID=2608339 RepID=UPI001421C419|nr:LuxR C-terminal-related transcriptional regulator [Chitinophaga sp. Cy-1792]NIG54981.1 response regulator transcription factor [Chitinophaga sp. Cy-1792]